MKAYKFLSLTFYIAIGYQLYCTANTAPIETKKEIKNTEAIAIHIPTTEEVIEKAIEKSKKKVKHLKKPHRYKLSKKGKDFIKSHESCVLKAYNDPDPKRRSVGWGHQIQPSENLEHITRAKADELFEKDIEWVNDAINRLIAQHDERFVYSQGFIDGLGDLIYNCGERGVTLTEFWNRWQKCRYSKDTENYINENDFNYTVAAVKISRISAPGHVTRRFNEHILMLN